jgi:HSP20 family protein
MTDKTTPQTQVLRSEHVFRPPVDVVELDDRYELRADVPGCRPEDVDVRFERGLLSIHAKVAPRRALQPGDEYLVGDWQLGLQFGEAVDADRIEAACERGVLTVTLGKAVAAQRRRIDVRAN